jgi:replicative DNA helicase
MSEVVSKKKPWLDRKHGFIKSLEYLDGRRQGQIKSLKTPWQKLNDATTAGLEWHNTIIIAGRPAAGKTLAKDQIIREAFVLNPSEKFRVLEFQFEMLAKNSAIREFSSYLNRSFKYMCSAEGTLTKEELDRCYEYAKERVKYPIDIVENPCTVNEFIQIIKDYMETHSVSKQVEKKVTVDGVPTTRMVMEKTYTNTIITLDHSLLLKKAPFEKDKYDMLHSLGEALTSLKRIYPITFIVLSQLNRNIDSPERNEDGKIGNYVLESDIFGSDALLQHGDLVIGLNRPGKLNIKFYGPERFIIDHQYILVMHFLKCRNGESGLAFFNAEFKRMTITEIPTPGKQEKRLRT